MPRIFDASELVRQREIRTIYTNVVGQQQAVQLGFTNRIKIVNGGTSASAYSQITSLGPIDTTPTERDAALTFVNAQITSTPAAAPPAAPVTSITARYIKFTVAKVRDGTSTTDAAVAEFKVMLGGSQVSFNAGKSIAYIDSTTNQVIAGDQTGSFPASFANGNLGDKAFPFLQQASYPRSIRIDNTTDITFSQYSWAMADQAVRDPIRWKLEVSSDGTTYTTVDDKTAADQSFTHANSTYLATITPDAITGTPA
jgi:hypothetical protein